MASWLFSILDSTFHCSLMTILVEKAAAAPLQASRLGYKAWRPTCFFHAVPVGTGRLLHAALLPRSIDTALAAQLSRLSHRRSRSLPNCLASLRYGLCAAMQSRRRPRTPSLRQVSCVRGSTGPPYLRPARQPGLLPAGPAGSASESQAGLPPVQQLLEASRV